MDMNYLVQRKINTRKAYRKKVTLTIVLGILLFVLILIGLIKVISDEKKADEGGNNGAQVSENLTPEAGADKETNPQGGATQDDTVQPDTGTPDDTADSSVTPEPTDVPEPTAAPLVSKKVVIDAGHGGDDLGSTRNGIYEKNANLAIALYLRDELKEAGYEVYMIRETDTAVENKERPATAIAENADIYVSIHLNSLDTDSDATQGAEVWYSDLRDDGSDTLAQCVVDELTAYVGMKNRGIKLSNKLIVLKYNGMPACLVECGFISSETERAKLFDAEYQQKVAKGIANGIKKYLPLE